MQTSLPNNVEILLEQLLSDEDYERRFAAEELGRLDIRDERIYLALKGVAQRDSNRTVRSAANHALELLGYPKPEETTSLAPKEPKMMLAADIVRNPSFDEDYNWKYMMIYDLTLASFTFHNLSKAICILGDRGWRAVSITSFYDPQGIEARYMYALLEKVNSDEPIQHPTEVE